MHLSERKIKKLEKLFIARADSAFAAAYQRALASGHSVLIAEQGEFCRIDPDGSRTVLEQIEPPTRVKRGMRVFITNLDRPSWIFHVGYAREAVGRRPAHEFAALIAPIGQRSPRESCRVRSSRHPSIRQNPY